MPSQQELIAAYTATRYEAQTTTGLISLRIGEKTPALADLLSRAALDTAAYVTAWNPGSVARSDEENASAHARLVREIESRAYPYYTGYGHDPSGLWPAEHSLLILGLSTEEACDLGRRFGQAAIVVSDATAVPRLLWLGFADA